MPDRKYLTAQCRTPRGGMNEVHILDLSEVGCLIDKRMIPMSEGDRILIKMEGLAFLPSSVLWVEENDAGLAFEQPLYGPVLEHLNRCFTVETLD